MQTILLIEDNTDILENTSEILELAGYKVITAENGKLGVEAAIAERPDLIICDIMMPVLDGYGVFHLIRKHPVVTHTPFIFLSARSDRSDLRKGMELGADDYITKPYTDTELLNAVEKRLEKMERLKTDLRTETEADPLEQMTGSQAMGHLVENRVVNRYRRKQPIFVEGNHPQYLFCLKKGKVKVFKSSETGKELTVGLYSEGDFIGYIAILQDDVYRVSAEALEDTEVALIPRAEFLETIRVNQEVSRHFFRLIASNNNEKAEKLVQLAYHSLRKRVADSLLALAEKYNAGSGAGFTIHISREELANLTGTATESLIRTLTDFRHEKLIDIREGAITLIDEKRLRRLAN